jgi:hypothetical protein
MPQWIAVQVFEQDNITIWGQQSEAVYKAQEYYQACLNLDDSAGVQPVLDVRIL